jgi:hypothetical protein
MRRLIEHLDDVIVTDGSMPWLRETEEDLIRYVMERVGISSEEEFLEFDPSRAPEFGLDEGIIQRTKGKIKQKMLKRAKVRSSKLFQKAEKHGLATKKGQKAYEKGAKIHFKVQAKRQKRREHLLSLVRKGEHERHLKAKKVDPTQRHDPQHRAAEPIEKRLHRARLVRKATAQVKAAHAKKWPEKEEMPDKPERKARPRGEGGVRDPHGTRSDRPKWPLPKVKKPVKKRPASQSMGTETEPTKHTDVKSIQALGRARSFVKKQQRKRESDPGAEGTHYVDPKELAKKSRQRKKKGAA